MKLLLLCFIHAFIANFNVSNGLDVVALQTGFDNYGVVAAFGDYNADKLVDVFVISPSGDQLDVLLVGLNYDFERQNLYNLTSDDEFISGIMLADFDGDLNNDILLCINQTSTSRIALEVVWGNKSRPTFRFKETFKATFLDQPVLFDYNADMLPDLLAEQTNGSWNIYVANVRKGFVHLEPLSRSPLTQPHSCAFIDLLEEYAADLFVTTQDGFEIYKNASHEAAKKYVYSHNGSHPTIFASSFGDFNQDAKLDHIIPICDDDKCSIQVYDYSTDKWSTMLSLPDDWVFQQLSYNHFQFPPTLHVGDYDMDGFPDVVTVLSSPTRGQHAVLLMNVPCTDDKCAAYGRMFDVKPRRLPSFINTTFSAAFFDISEDGSLDVVLTAKVSNMSVPELVFLNSDVAADTCFLKVTVASGTHSHSQTGLNVPGPTVKYSTTTTSGDQVHSAGGQLSQSAHFALQLPYVMFGLGQTPNFVEEVRVGVPNVMEHVKYPMVKRFHVWQQIIPNSQLVITPYPLDKPSWWQMKLIVMPSKKLWYTGIALAGTCVVGAIIVGALHIYEKHEDSKEKKQESQKFHFDAM